MAHIELSVADDASPELRKACYENRVTMVPNPEREDSVHFLGKRDDLVKLIESEFDSGDPEDVAFLVKSIE